MAMATSMVFFAGWSCEISPPPSEPEPPPPPCVDDADCASGSCIDGECIVDVGCYSDEECGADQYCDLGYDALPAERPDGEEGAAEFIAPEGVCRDLPNPPGGECTSDADCNPDEYCAIYETFPGEPCYEAEDGSTNCADDIRIAPEGQCEPLNPPPPPPPAECFDDSDCRDGQVCVWGATTMPCFDEDGDGQCDDAGDRYYEMGQCVDVEPPPYGECDSDSDCGPNEYCEWIDICYEPAPMPDCAEDDPDCWGGAYPCEVTTQCVPYEEPLWCGTDADCPDGFRCLIEGQPQPGGLIAGQCIPDDVSNCEEECLWEVDAFLNECLEYADEESCFSEAEWIFQDCVESRCYMPPPPPPNECYSDADCGPYEYCEYYDYAEPDYPGDEPGLIAPGGYCMPYEQNCEEQCFMQYDEFLQHCELIDIPFEDCAREAEYMLDDCLGSCHEPPPPPPHCDELCGEEYFWFIQECEQSGDPECFEHAEIMFEECMQSCNEPPPPPQCEDGCFNEFEAFLMECDQIGSITDPNFCYREAELFLDQCLQSCEPPPPPACEEECYAAYDDAFLACLAEGNDPHVCDRISSAVFEGCLDRCDGIEPPPSGECQTDADCGDGGRCETIEWCADMPYPCEIGPNGEEICPEPEPSCGSESICVYETEPEPPPSECHAGDVCADGSECIVEEVCYFYCDANDPDCCFEVGHCGGQP